MGLNEFLVFSLVIYVVGIFIAIIAATTVIEEDAIICVIIGIRNYFNFWFF